MFIALLLAGAPSGADDIARHLHPDRICSITDVIDIGVNRPSPTRIVETVQRIDGPRGPGWRAIHIPLDVVDAWKAGRATFDVVDVDAATLAQRSSMHRYDEVTACVFDDTVDGGQATRTATPTAPAETIPLRGQRPIPEGPGDPILTQAIDWRPGLTLRAWMLDRWRGAGAQRLKRITLRVTGTDTELVGDDEHPVFIVTKTPDDGSFSIESRVTRARPHRTVRTSYRSGPNATPYISETIAMSDGADCDRM